MGKTDNTRPWRLKEADGIPFFHRGGVWHGIHYFANLRNRQARRKAKATLHKGDEPHPYKHGHGARWDMY